MRKEKRRRKRTKEAAVVLGLVVLLLCSTALVWTLFRVPEANTGGDITEGDITEGDSTEGTDTEETRTGETVPAPEPPTTEEILQTRISEMSLEEKVGQMFLVRCPAAADGAEGDETRADAAVRAAVRAVKKYHMGGYIFFSRDFREFTRTQVEEKTAACQSASAIPMLMGVDEEGGIVNRVSLYPQFRAVPFWSPQDLYREGGFELIESDTEEKCELLLSLGLNMNMAPVCDVSTDPGDYIYSRTFGQDGESTAEYVKRVVTVMNQEHVGSVLKHFPGYGNNVDTHSGFSVDERPYETFVENDFVPFEAGIEAGAGSVLVSHNMVTSMDKSNPASLSEAVHKILREELGFTGVIMTDDLDMEAVKKFAGAKQAAVMAVLAGNDMLCCTDYKTQIPAVIEAVRDGTIDEERIDRSVLRILKWKLDLGLIELSE